MRITLTVNGDKHTLEVPQDMPLLWILRDVLKFTGTKYGCGLGICGACTVHMDGEAVRACQVTADEAAETSIVTIEGLSEHGDHPCQRAWLEEDVAQCGFCQPGMIMTAAALLGKNDSPSDADIDEIMSDAVCRCGSYLRIRKAIKRAAEGMTSEE